MRTIAHNVTTCVRALTKSNTIILINRSQLKLRGERFIYSIVAVCLNQGLCPKNYFPLDKNQVKYLKVGHIRVTIKCKHSWVRTIARKNYDLSNLDCSVFVLGI